MRTYYAPKPHPVSKMSSGANRTGASGGPVPSDSEQDLHKQAAFMQRKLEGAYKKTHQFLSPWKEWIEEAENVLVWRKPLVASFLYLAVHMVFM